MQITSEKLGFGKITIVLESEGEARRLRRLAETATYRGSKTSTFCDELLSGLSEAGS